MSKTDDNGADELTASSKVLEIRQRRAEHNETVPINRLPVELFCMLLEYLDRGQLFEYESVCKKWAYFVKVFVHQKLVISRENEVRPLHWFYRDERCLPHAVASSMMILEWTEFLLQPKWKVEPVANSFCFDLKQLKICNSSSYRNPKQSLHEVLKVINRLTALEVLEVSQLPYGTLSLPNLRHLAIDKLSDFCESKSIFIDCPQLLSFKTKMLARGSRNFEFSHPTSITHLYLDLYSYKDTFEQLTSLQYMSVMGFDYDKERTKDHVREIFSNFPKLKEVSLRSGLLGDKSQTFAYIRSFIGLLEEKQALRRDDVVLTFCGVSIESEAQLDWMDIEHYIDHEPHLLRPKFYLENYSSLREPELRWIQIIHYDELSFPADFHEKFRYVREIRVNSWMEDEDRLIKFILGFKRLESLVVEDNTELSESFYRELARCSSIPYLAIWLESEVDVFYLDFLLEFKHLVCFTLYTEDIDDQFVQRLFDRFESFELNYKVEDDDIKIRRPRKGADFELSVDGSFESHFSECNDLLEYIESEYRNQRRIHVCNCVKTYLPNDW